MTTKELNILLSKKSLSPCTFILKPGHSLFVGGVARLDYIEVNSNCVLISVSLSWGQSMVTRGQSARVWGGWDEWPSLRAARAC